MAAEATPPAEPGGDRLVFFDASVLVAASRSPSGGSAVALEVCRGRRFRGAVTQRFLLEARLNIAEKFGEPELLRFYQQLAALEPRMVRPPSEQGLVRCAHLVGEKDAHVLAAALDCSSEYLLTLDRRHLITPAVKSAGLPIKVMTPGEFLKDILSDVSRGSSLEDRGR